MTKIFQILMFLLIVIVRGQSYNQLISYADYYGKDISKFIYFMKIEPSATHSNGEIEQLVYEMDNHNIGIEEHSSNNGKIGEIYIFQTTDDRSHAQSKWKDYVDSMARDKSFRFVKAVFEDEIVKENHLTYDGLISLLDTRTLNTNRSYGVRYTKHDAYFSLLIIKGKLVFTVDDKNH